MNDYPFELWVYVVSGAGSEDSYGFETEVTGEWVKHSDCYEQVMGQSMVYHKENGDSFSYSSKLFLPDDTTTLADGTMIQVRQNGSVRFEGISKRFSRDIEHCRLWA